MLFDRRTKIMIDGDMKLLYLIGFVLGYTDACVAQAKKRTAALTRQTDNGKSESACHLSGVEYVFRISRRTYSEQHVILFSKRENTLSI